MQGNRLRVIVHKMNIVSFKIVIDKEIKIRFNADKEKDLGVYFQPVKRSIVTKLGKTNSVEYKITNNSNKTIEAIAS